MEIFIDKEFRSLIPPLSADELKGLEESILTEGMRDSIVVWDEKKVILDGHNRYDICTKHNIPIPENKVCLKHFDDKDDAKLWIIRNQFGRRNINAFQRSVLALAFKDIIAEKAKKKQKEHGGTAPGKSLPLMSGKVSVDTNIELGKIAKVGHDTIDKVMVIQAKATLEQIEKLNTGELTVNQVYNAVQTHVGYATGEYEWYTPSIYVEAARTVMGTTRHIGIPLYRSWTVGF